MFVKIIFTFLLLILVSCTSAKKSNSAVSQEKNDTLPAVEKYKTLAVEKYKDQIDYVFNQSKTHVLCARTSKPTPKMPENNVSFFVFDLNHENIIFEESIVDGSVTWINNRQLEIIQKTGIISGENPDRRHGYIFDVESKTKTDLLNKSTENLKQ